jgi:hypothetical protein
MKKREERKMTGGFVAPNESLVFLKAVPNLEKTSVKTHNSSPKRSITG